MKSIDETRELLKSVPRSKRCNPKCKGWEIFEVNRPEGIEIEGCDECLSYLKEGRPTDDEIARLPEAREALAKRISKDRSYSALGTYDMDRALGMISEWVSAGKSQDETMTGIATILNGLGYRTREW